MPCEHPSRSCAQPEPPSGTSRGDEPRIARPSGVGDASILTRAPALRQEIAAAAAQRVAESGLDYGQAKLEAAQDVLQGAAIPRGMLPDNAELDAALASHLDLFDPDHAPRVQRMRTVALELMERLAAFDPWITGSVWKGIVAEHVPIHLQVFHDDPKEVVLFLLDLGLPFDAAELPALGQGHEGSVEAVELQYRDEPVQIALHPTDARRQGVRATHRSAERGDRAALKMLIDRAV